MDRLEDMPTGCWALGQFPITYQGKWKLNRKPRAFVDTNPTPEPITSGLRVIQDD
jgi:hypothetical protein